MSGSIKISIDVFHQELCTYVHGKCIPHRSFYAPAERENMHALPGMNMTEAEQFFSLGLCVQSVAWRIRGVKSCQNVYLIDPSAAGENARFTHVWRQMNGRNDHVQL